jgi:hypothetical protein
VQLQAATIMAKELKGRALSDLILKANSMFLSKSF